VLRDVVAGFLDTVTEREFDAPLLALLAARGFTDVHFLHGAFEFGKDFIAKGLKPAVGDTGTGDPAFWVRHQFALQSKAGDLGLQEWREVRGQLDEARLDGLAHPSFDRDLPRAAVLVTTGRLIGGAAVQAGSYREAERGRGRPDFEVWDREPLLDWLADSPDAGLAGSSDGPILALAGAIDAGEITFTALERRARAWLPAVPGSLTAATDPAAEVAARQRRAAVEAAVLANRLRRHGRVDLAAMTALLLLRAAWCHTLTASPDTAPARPQEAQAAIHMFAGYAGELLEQVEPVAKDPHAMLSALTPVSFPHASYPAGCARIMEILGLLGLLACGSAAGELALPGDRIARTVQDLLDHQPGCAHPVSDGFAVSLIAPVILTARHDPDAARRYLSRTAVWVADRYDPDRGGIGLASTSADPAAEVAYLLGGPFENGPRRRPFSYLATALTDLVALIPQSGDLYADLVNDFLAVDADPQLLRADERRAQWRPGGAGATLTSKVSYAEPLPRDSSAARHFRDPAAPIPAWDALALTSIARDRHVVDVLHANLTQQSQPAEGSLDASSAGPATTSPSATMPETNT
jgi:hypothetical protein